VAGFLPPAPGWPVRFGPDRTIELRVDVIQFSQEDAFAGLEVYGKVPVAGYTVVLERNEIVLNKFGMSSTGWADAFFLWESVALPIAPLTLSAAFTQVGDDLLIYLRILDRTEQTVLWERKVWDTAGDDPVLPNRSVRGLLMKPEPFAAPYTWQDMYPCVLIGYVNTTTAPTQPIEAIIDNVEVREYRAPVAEIEKAVCLSWPADALEAQIVVGADSIEGPWRPWPAPIYKQSGRWCMAAPITTGQQWVQPAQYFRLMPGTQCIDDFDPPKWPYATKGNWVPWFNHANDDATRWSVTSADGVLRVRTLHTPADLYGRLAITPPGPLVHVKDFWASVDILDLTTTHGGGEVDIAARTVWDPETGFPGNANSYLGGVVPNIDGANHARLIFWPGAPPDVLGKVFTFKPGTPYRLIFSALGRRFSVELIDLETGQAAVDRLEVTHPTATPTQGFVGLYVQTGGPATLDATFDNYFVTGTKPVSP
jgi:hypothetical protein